MMARPAEHDIPPDYCDECPLDDCVWESGKECRGLRLLRSQRMVAGRLAALEETRREKAAVEEAARHERMMQRRRELVDAFRAMRLTPAKENA